MRFTLVTGNAGKLAEWRRLLPSNVSLQHKDLDLLEIQSFDSAQIVAHKLRQAYDIVQGPVVVEDVSAGLDSLHGLPGPFVKFFEQQLGERALYILAGKPATASASCTIGYYDGEHELIVDGTVHGSVVPGRGDGGFGFDKVFMPDGQPKTYAEMTAAEKDAVSHRHLAIDELLARLEQL